MKYLLITFFICFVTLLVCFVIFIICFHSDLSGLFTSLGFNSREVFLKQTDFPELLKAGRELISKAVPEANNNKPAVVRDFRLVIPKDVNEPDIILKLEQKISGRIMDRYINSGCFVISFRSPHEADPFGVVIFPEDFNESVSKFTNPDDIMIMPGMWYFDDAYYQFPKLREENERMIKKNKSLKKR